MGESLQQLIALNAVQEKDVERVRQRDELLQKVFLIFLIITLGAP